MMGDRANARELAKQGNPDAIAVLMNRKLVPNGITASISRESDCLEIVLKADKIPNQDKLIKFIQGGIKELGVSGINTVKVVGQKISDEFPVWEQMLSLETIPTSQLTSPSAIQNSRPVKPPEAINTSPVNSHECPQCQSSNIYIFNDKQAVCQDCANVFESAIKKSQSKLPQAEQSKVRKFKSIFASWRKREYLVIGVVGVLFVGGISSLWLNRDPYICSKKQREQVVLDLDPIIADWDNAERLASSTSRINLTVPVSKLQEIQKEVRQLEFPECAQPVKEHFLEMSDKNIDSYFFFMRDAGDAVVQISFSSAKDSQDSFINYYSRLKKGETLDQKVVNQEISEESEKE